MSSFRFSLSRQVIGFGLIGLLQLGVDVIAFGCLLSLGWPAGLSNLTSRFGAACLGYLLNRSLTFRKTDGTAPMPASSVRFLFWWSLTTLVGSSILEGLGQLQLDWLWLLAAKFLVEGALVLASFVAYRYWVYR